MSDGPRRIFPDLVSLGGPSSVVYYLVFFYLGTDLRIDCDFRLHGDGCEIRGPGRAELNTDSGRRESTGDLGEMSEVVAGDHDICAIQADGGDEIIEGRSVLSRQPDAAMGDRHAETPRRVGAMDGMPFGR